MPNYNITIDSKFDPYSFEDYLKPLSILQEQHNQAADAYATALANSAGMEDALAAHPDDIDYLNQYNTYRQTLNDLADDLSKNGISRTTRRGVYQAKADYGNIAKMQEAIKQREEILKERKNLFEKDNTIIFDRPDDSFSIKSIMSGNTSYKPLSLQGVTNQVISQVQNFAKTAYDREPNPEIKKKYQYLLEEIKTGVMPSEIQEIISGKEPTTEMGKQLKGIVENVVNNSIASGNWDESQQKSIRDFANRGLYNAIGTKEVKWHQDLEAQEAARRAERAEISVPPETQLFDNMTVSTKGVSKTSGSKKSQIAATEQMKESLSDNNKAFKVNPFAARNMLSNAKKYVEEYYGNTKDGAEALDILSDLITDGIGYWNDGENYYINNGLIKDGDGYQHLYNTDLIDGLAYKSKFRTGYTDEKQKKARNIVDNFLSWQKEGGTYTDVIQYKGINQDQIVEMVRSQLDATAGHKQIKRFAGVTKDDTINDSKYVDYVDFSKKLKDESLRKTMQFGLFKDENGNEQLYELVTFTNESDGKQETYTLPVDKNIQPAANGFRSYIKASDMVSRIEENPAYQNAIMKAYNGETTTQYEQYLINQLAYWEKQRIDLYKIGPQLISNRRYYTVSPRTQTNSSNMQTTNKNYQTIEE